MPKMKAREKTDRKKNEQNIRTTVSKIGGTEVLATAQFIHFEEKKLYVDFR